MKAEAHELHFLGAVGGMEARLVAESGLAFAAYHEVYAGPLHGVNILRSLSSILKLKLGSLQALSILRSTRPEVILLTGGWANLPVALGARLLGIPIVIYLPDIEPGMAIKALQRFAKRVAVSVEESARNFPAGKAVVTGYPLQASRLNAERRAAHDHFNLDPRRKTLLVFGGSRGARNINVALAGILKQLLEDGLQIIHVTGAYDHARHIAQAGPLVEEPHYHVFAYLHDEMGLAFAAADLAVCRAGASTLAELPHFGLPAILAPYPYAWRYQKVNADYLVRRGAAVRLNDEDMTEYLYETITSLLADEKRFDAMRVKSKSLSARDGAQRLAELLLEVGGAGDA